MLCFKRLTTLDIATKGFCRPDSARRHATATLISPTSIILSVAEPNPSPATLTFLFTDIEGSTNLWEQYPDAMRSALATHDVLMRQAIERQGGKIFKTVGDAFHAVFGKPEDALAAAI